MNRKIFIAAILALFVDQISKVLVGAFFHVGEQFVVIKKFFSVYFIENYGAAWSIFSNKNGFLIVVSLLAIFVIIRYMYSFKKNKRNNLAFGFIIGGIFGNLIDRVFLGYVRDFLSFRIFGYNYPVFNFADIFIVLGVFLLIFAIMKGEDRNGKKESNS